MPRLQLDEVLRPTTGPRGRSAAASAGCGACASSSRACRGCSGTPKGSGRPGGRGSRPRHRRGDPRAAPGGVPPRLEAPRPDGTVLGYDLLATFEMLTASRNFQDPCGGGSASPRQTCAACACSSTTWTPAWGPREPPEALGGLPAALQRDAREHGEPAGREAQHPAGAHPADGGGPSR